MKIASLTERRQKGNRELAIPAKTTHQIPTTSMDYTAFKVLLVREPEIHYHHAKVSKARVFISSSHLLH
jgi:hypothetical protein